MTREPPILVCDHRGECSDTLVAILSRDERRVEMTTNLRRSIAAVRHERPHLLVVLPLVSGGAVEIETLDEARSGVPAVPMLVVADRRMPQTAYPTRGSLIGGPWDLIDKSASPEELRLRIARLEAEVESLREMEELRHLAFHDDRTQLLRVREFERRLGEHFAAAKRHEFPLAFALLDLDKFGQVNKRYGHTVGDELIARVGAVVRDTLRTEDVAGRLGGDEFGVVLPYTRKVDAARVLQRLLERIRELSGRIPGVPDEVRVAASMGFETFDGTDLDGPDALRQSAERALRVAKRSGGDKAVYGRQLDDGSDDEA